MAAPRAYSFLRKMRDKLFLKTGGIEGVQLGMRYKHSSTNRK